MVRHLMTRPSAVRSKTKSIDQTSLAADRPTQRLPLAHRHLLPLAPPHLQRSLLIQPLDALVVHQLAAFLPKLQVDHPDAVALVPLRQRHDPLAQRPRCGPGAAA